MLKDHNHDLIHQLSETSDSRWRIEKNYLETSSDCEYCRKLWQQLHDDYEKHIGLITEEIKRHITEERFN